ncbi:MAG: hypothetical protein NXI32_21935 [bacterium]|nr:hypothetical protein [bacterium]
MAELTDVARWKKWADALRQEMMVGLTPEITKTIEMVADESETKKAMKTLRSTTFWDTGKAGATTRDLLATAGFEVEAHEGEDKRVSEITFKLNNTWRGIMQNVIDRGKR